MNQKAVLLIVFWVIIFVPTFFVAQNYTGFISGNPDDAEVNVQPAFVLAGGGTDNDDAMKWMLSRATGGDVLVLRASGSNGYNKYFFEELGVKVHSVETIIFLNKQASSEPYVLEQIKNAEIIFIAGGDQTKYHDYWTGTETGELLKSICEKRTKVIGGTSAGMMILGNVVYAPVDLGVTSAEALANPYHPNLNNIKYNTLMQTPLFANTIFDTHFDNRSRGGRLLVFLAKTAFEKNIRAKAIACNESTAVCIDENNMAFVFGDAPEYPEYAYFLEVNCEEDWKPTSMSQNVKVQWTTFNGNAVIVQRLKGNKLGSNKFDLNTWKSIGDSDNEYWQINNGVVQKTSTTFTGCSLKLSSLSEISINPVVVYPNPADSVVYFPQAEIAELFTKDGIKITSARDVQKLDISFCKSGEYILNITINSVMKSIVLIKN